MNNHQRYPLGDYLSTLSFILSWGANAIGKTYHVIIPLHNLTLDGRGDEAALFSTFDDLKLLCAGSVRATLLASDVRPAFGALAQDDPEFDVRRDVRYSLQFAITIPAGTQPQENVILAVFGHTIASGIEPPAQWPAIGVAPGAITIQTPGGSPVAARVVETPPVAPNPGPQIGTVGGTVAEGNRISSKAVLSVFEHFLSLQGIPFQTTGQYTGNGGSVADAQINNNPAVDKTKGVIGLGMNDNCAAGTSAAIWTAMCIYLDADPLMIALSWCPTAGYADNAKYMLRFGMCQNQMETQPLNSFGWFEYDGSVSPNWLCCTARNGTKSIIDSGVPVRFGQYTVLNDLTELKIVCLAPYDSIKFYIDGNLVQTITTNLPDANIYTHMRCAAAMVSNGVFRYTTCAIDWVQIQWGGF